MVKIEETKEGKELLDQLDRSSRMLAYHLAEANVAEAIVKDPALAEQKEQKWDALYEEYYPEILEALKENFLQFSTLYDLLKPFLDKLPLHEKEQVEADFQKIIQVKWNRLNLEDPDFSIQNFTGVSNETIGWVYQVAQVMIRENRMDHAITLLKYLNLLNPFLPEVWLSLGYCFQLKGFFEAALEPYRVANALDEENPHVHIFAAQCYLELKQVDKARLEVEDLKRALKNHPQRDQFYSSLQTLQSKVV